MTKTQAFLLGCTSTVIIGSIGQAFGSIGYTPDLLVRDICKVRSFNTQSVTLFCADEKELIVYPRSRYEALKGEVREGKVSGP